MRRPTPANHDTKHFLDYTAACKKTWQDDLRNGRLNKSVNDKLRVYGHLKALSSRKLEPYVPPVPTVTDDGDAHDLDREETLPDLPSSPVLFEDQSKPPWASEDTSPVYFTSDEFFKYVWSDSWAEHITLRVIGGNLLQLLLTALYSLERKQSFYSLVQHANLNNVQRTETVNEAQRRRTSNAKPVGEWMSEKLVVQLVFYDKPDMSNLFYDITDKPTGPQTKLRSQNVLRPPYALRQYRMNNVKLPSSEDLSSKKRIETLKSELAAYKKALVSYQQKQEEHQGKGGLKYKGALQARWFMEQLGHPSKGMSSMDALRRTRASPQRRRIDNIAEDPTLVRSGVSGDKSWTGTPGSLITLSDTVMPSLSRSQALIATEVSSPHLKQPLTEVSSPQLKGVSSLSLVKEKPSDSSLRDLFGEEPDNGYEGENEEEEKEADAKKETGVYKRLNLTRDELYVTGLYYPREENRQLTADKLRKIKAKRVRSRSAVLSDTMKVLKERSPHHNMGFKCLARSKKGNARNANANRVQRNDLSQKKLTATDQWCQYIRDQEQVEMAAAVLEKCESGLQQRMWTRTMSDGQLMCEDTQDLVDSKDKKDKNKNKNKNKNKKPELRQPKAASLKRVKGTCLAHELRIANMQREFHRTYYNYAELLRYETPRHRLTVPEMCAELKRMENTPDYLRSLVFAKSPRRVKNPVIKAPVENIARKDTKMRDGFDSKSTGLSRPQNTEAPADPDLVDQNVSRLVDYEEEAKPRFLPPIPEAKAVSNWPRIPGEPRLSDLSKSETSNLWRPFFDEHQLTAEEIERFECDCPECKTQRDALIHLRPEDKSYELKGYPLTLGKLSNDFQFLKYRDYIPQRVGSKVEFRKQMTVVNVCDQLFNLIDHVMIRKEILSSSLGHTYITVTFTKRAS